MQLTTVGKEVLRGARKARELQEAGAGDPTVQERLRKLKQVEALRKYRVGWPEIQELLGISRATYCAEGPSSAKLKGPKPLAGCRSFFTSTE